MRPSGPGLAVARLVPMGMTVWLGRRMRPISSSRCTEVQAADSGIASCSAALACSYVDCLEPNQAEPYAWDEPTQRNQLRVQVGGRAGRTRSEEAAVSHNGPSNKCAWPTASPPSGLPHATLSICCLNSALPRPSIPTARPRSRARRPSSASPTTHWTSWGPRWAVRVHCGGCLSCLGTR